MQGSKSKPAGLLKHSDRKCTTQQSEANRQQWENGFAKRVVSTWSRIGQRGKGSGLPVISARSSQLIHEDQSLVIKGWTKHLGMYHDHTLFWLTMNHSSNMFNSRMVKYNRQVWTIWFCQDPVSHSGGVRATAGHWHSTNSLSMTQMPVTWDKIGDIPSGSTSQREGPKEEKVAHAREKERIGGSSGNENCNSMIRKPLSKVTVKSHRPFSSTIRFENGLQMDANGSSESEFLEGLSCYYIVDLGAGLAHSGPACGVPPWMIAFQLLFMLMYVKG